MDFPLLICASSLKITFIQTQHTSLSWFSLAHYYLDFFFCLTISVRLNLAFLTVNLNFS